MHFDLTAPGEPIQRELWRQVSAYFVKKDDAGNIESDVHGPKIKTSLLARRLSLAAWQLAKGQDLNRVPGVDDMEAYEDLRFSHQSISDYRLNGYIPLRHIPAFQRLLVLLKESEAQKASQAQSKS